MGDRGEGRRAKKVLDASLAIRNDRNGGRVFGDIPLPRDSARIEGMAAVAFVFGVVGEKPSV